MEKTEARRLRGSGDVDRSGALGRDFPEQPMFAPPMDVAPPTTPEQLAQRVRFRRQPPEMALTWGALDQPATPAASSPDLAHVCGLPTAELAYCLAELAARLESSVRYSGDLDAQRGLSVLSLQARMYEHLHLLQTSSVEAS